MSIASAAGRWKELRPDDRPLPPPIAGIGAGIVVDGIRPLRRAARELSMNFRRPVEDRLHAVTDTGSLGGDVDPLFAVDLGALGVCLSDPSKSLILK